MLSWKAWLRVVIFALHFLVALASLGVLFWPKCRVADLLQPATRDESVYDETAVCRGNETACFRQGLGWVDDVEVAGFEWNPYTGVVVFEWLTASFALYYLRDVEGWPFQLVYLGQRGKNNVWNLYNVWNALGLLLLCVAWCVRGSGIGGGLQLALVILSFVLTVAVHYAYAVWVARVNLQYFSSGMSLVMRTYAMPGGQVWNIPTRVRRVAMASKAQQGGLYYPVPAVAVRLGPDAAGDAGVSAVPQASPAAGPEVPQNVVWKVFATQSEVVLRYSEYCLTASILWASVLLTLVTAPPLWMVLLGFIGIFACNLYGIPLQLLQTCQRVDAVRKKGCECKNEFWAFLGLGSWKPVWVAMLAYAEGAWVGLAVGLLILLYVVRGILFSATLPWQVSFYICNLLLWYSSFGIVASAIYLVPAWAKHMDVALDVLSASAKLPIACVLLSSFFLKPYGITGCGD